MLAAAREQGLLATGSAGRRACSPVGATRPACSTSRSDRRRRTRSRALHVNYGLRDAADADERHCAELCERLGVQLDVRRRHAGGRRRAARQPAGVGARRALRRGRASSRSPRDADVAAGHTATDQVETILYRLASSPSRRALLGMRPRDGVLVRPLLAFTREDTAAYCTRAGLRWRDDESNESPATRATGSAAGLVPALRAVHPAAQENVLALAEILRGEADVLDELVDDGARRPGRDRAGAAARAAAGAAAARGPAAGRPGRSGARRRAPRGGPRRWRRCSRPSARRSLDLARGVRVRAQRSHSAGTARSVADAPP